MPNIEFEIHEVHRYVIGIDDEIGNLIVFIEQDIIGENPTFTHAALARSNRICSPHGGNLIVDNDQLIHIEDSGTVNPSSQEELDKASKNGLIWVK